MQMAAGKVYRGFQENISVWDIQSGAPVAHFRAHDAPVKHMVLGDDEIVSVGNDRCIRAWNLHTLERQWSIDAPDEVLTIAVDIRSVVVGCRAACVCLLIRIT